MTPGLLPPGKAELSTRIMDTRGLIREAWEEINALNPERHPTLKMAEISERNQTSDDLTARFPRRQLGIQKSFA